MPTPEEILRGLELIAHKWRLLVVLWHIYFAVIILIMIFGVRPAKRIAGLLLAFPLFSVSILAFIHENAFNGTVFALIGIILIIIALKLPFDPVQFGSRLSIFAGIFMFVFGWIYPHFLDDSSLIVYLYAAPTGLIPCPTLSIVIGLTLMLNGMGSRAWSSVLALFGLFYGAFGAFRLGVRIDLILLAGALLTGYRVFMMRSITDYHEKKAR